MCQTDYITCVWMGVNEYKLLIVVMYSALERCYLRTSTLQMFTLRSLV